MQFKTFTMPLVLMAGMTTAGAALAAVQSSEQNGQQADHGYFEHITQAAERLLSDGCAELQDNDARGIEQAGISLAEAISLAENQLGGMASRAALEWDDGMSTFDIEIVHGDLVMDVTLDARDGQVLAASSDTPDGEYDDEDEGEGDD
ncbi:PepSY domain-containing protein [Candidatus Thalassolituus haligoni]|jgi:uncharacterized membrane protein YkoI|uniref:PepSY domain-containing protein n=1 Tax=Candidatus Thalassolituus haligoni TaxID=3100113 RepID=UPI0035146060|tara:strand:+ start:9022 stop:9465 length:444 start_codon:yes stop_codon:yes gene_type:complete